MTIKLHRVSVIRILSLLWGWDKEHLKLTQYQERDKKGQKVHGVTFVLYRKFMILQIKMHELKPSRPQMFVNVLYANS